MSSTQNEHAAPENPVPSPGYTIAFDEGVNDQLKLILLRLHQSEARAFTAATYEELAAMREQTIAQMSSFLRSFVGSLLSSNPHDKNVRISVDGPESFFFRYDSGYHGAMIFHPDAQDPFASRWSVHT